MLFNKPKLTVVVQPVVIAGQRSSTMTLMCSKDDNNNHSNYINDTAAEFKRELQELCDLADRYDELHAA